ncbi:PP2C family protein-serine/threonine phosphatase [Kineococcus gynurae]|uniref:PP2C family protein-serine/threonine phosphatase n=1 Tax=Kineococcus gynurae TaxID=452979 RepID=A0ABV5LRK0_9ACTN
MSAMTRTVAGLPDAMGADLLRDLLVRAVNAGRNAVCLSDVSLPDQPVVWVNEAFTTITGYTFQQTVGRNCRFLQDGLTELGYDVRGPARRIRDLISLRASGTVLIPNRRADGRIFCNELALSPLVERSGEVRYYLGVQQDVSARIAAERARDRSYEEAAQLADQLQNRLVPRTLPSFDDWDVAVRYRAATRPDGSRGEVSGDFYDLVGSPGQRPLAVIGDVSGRGPRAAATTAALRWSVRGLAGVLDSPAEVLRHVAGSVHEALDDRFATLVAARLPGSAEDPDVTVSLAGHPAPLLIPRDGPVRAVGRPGMLIGPFAGVDVHDAVLPVRSGEFLVLYTDGVTEAVSPRHELLGEDGLLAALEGARPWARKASDVVEAVLTAVAEHVAGGPTDDLTLMVLRRR